ncbi:glycosyltransferase, partial [Bacillus subtilis]
MKQGLISIIIPSYNEGYNVKLIHESLKKEFKNIHYDYEIFFINDGSVDDT